MAFSPKGDRIVSGSEDRTVRVWSTRGSRLIAILNIHTGSVRSVVFSNQGNEILSGSEDRTLRRWSWCSDVGRPMGDPICGHTGAVCSVAYSSDGGTIVSGSFDGPIRLWYEDGEPAEIVPLSHKSSVWSIAIAPNNQRILSGHGRGISLWNGDHNGLGGIRERFSDSHIVGNKCVRCVRCVAFSPDGETITHGSDGIAVYLLNNRLGSKSLEHIAVPLPLSVTPTRFCPLHSPQMGKCWCRFQWIIMSNYGTYRYRLPLCMPWNP